MNKTVLITGTSKGIGRTTAELFIEKGFNVIATMRSPEKETELQKNTNALVTRLDITQPESIQKAIAEGVAKFGKIDVLVNNAAFGQFGLFEAVTPEQIDEQFRVTVFGTMNVTRAILPHFRENKGGTVVNISSGAGRVGMPMVSMYSSAKFAIEGFSESLYYELLPQNIKVKIIEPGGVDTPFHETAAKIFAVNENLTDYNDFMQKFTRKFESMHGGMATTSQVANVVLTAVTDDTKQLRYVIGNDVSEWVKARLTMTENDYVDYMVKMYGI
ncbi:MAG: SDR family oxidoreductase [Cruoricaptor ignavus]|nr:SDR family oxidoreductase [Cruoricaptor ignavus]